MPGDIDDEIGSCGTVGLRQIDVAVAGPNQLGTDAGDRIWNVLQAAVASGLHHLFPSGQVGVDVRPGWTVVHDNAGQRGPSGIREQDCVFALPIVVEAVI